MHRFAPPLVLVSVTALLLFYGPHHWSWLAGPVASLVVWALDRKSHEPSARAATRARIAREPAPVE